MSTCGGRPRWGRAGRGGAGRALLPASPRPRAAGTARPRQAASPRCRPSSRVGKGTRNDEALSFCRDRPALPPGCRGAPGANKGPRGPAGSRSSAIRAHERGSGRTTRFVRFGPEVVGRRRKRPPSAPLQRPRDGAARLPTSAGGGKGAAELGPWTPSAAEAGVAREEQGSAPRLSGAAPPPAPSAEPGRAHPGGPPVAGTARRCVCEWGDERLPSLFSPERIGDPGGSTVSRSPGTN